MAIILAEEGIASVRESLTSQVAAELLPLLPSTARLVSIDGLDGVGKSTVAEAIALCSHATLIQLDPFLQQNQNRFLEALDLVALKARIESSGKAVVEGCLIQAALAKIGLISDFSVYVVRTTQMYAQPDMEWVEERELLFGGKDADQMIADEEDSSLGRILLGT